MAESPVQMFGLGKRAVEMALRVAWRRSLASFGPGSNIVTPVDIDGPRGVSIGSGVWLGPACRLATWEGGQIVIGDGCRITGRMTLESFTRIELEPRVLIATNVQIVTAQHRSDEADQAILDQGFERHGEVRVKEGAWLASNVVVMPGVSIGRNAIVGANSVVTKDVPDYATVAGAPARVVANRAFTPAAA